MHLLPEASLRTGLHRIILGCSQAVYTRELHYSFVEPEHTVQAGFNSVSLLTIRRISNRARRWIEAYIGRLNEGICGDPKIFTSSGYG